MKMRIEEEATLILKDRNRCSHVCPVCDDPVGLLLVGYDDLWCSTCGSLVDDAGDVQSPSMLTSQTKLYK
jgi:hypothetical protein